MRLPRFRVRSLMMMVLAVALAFCGMMMGTQSYEYYARARMHDHQEADWRKIAAEDVWVEISATKTADYHAGLAAKYRRAMWCPWARVEPDS